MKNYYFVSGLGQSKSKQGAFTKALEVGSLSHCRSLLHTNTLPRDALFLEGDQVVPSDSITDVILEMTEGKRGEFISAGVILGDFYRKGKKEKTVIYKQSGLLSEIDLEHILHKELMESCEKEYEIHNVKTVVKGLRVEEDHGSVFVGIGFAEKFLPLAGQYPECVPFLGKQSSYEKAKYVVVPVLYEYPPQKKGGHAPASILKASKNMEDYDLETDYQLSSAGVHTMDALASSEAPHLFIGEVKRTTEKLLKDKKLPIFLGEDQTLTIGVLQGIKECVGDVSLLHLGASTQLRPSYDGSQYSQACAMKKALEYVKDIVQVGIRTTSNREKKELQYDKIFFASDIFSEPDDHWMEDVIEELSMQNIYITIDASVFDPSVMMSRKPEPMGLFYAQVIKLLKKVTRRKKLIGIDFVGLQPNSGESFSERTAARMLYQVLCYLTKN